MMGNFEEQSSPISSTSDYLSKTFFRMFLGLFATALVAGYTYYSGMVETLIYSNSFVFIFIAELIVVIAFSLGFRKFSSGVVTALFFVYAILTGVTFSTLFVIFELSSIFYVFLGSAAIFGILALIGKNTTKDLSSFGTMLSVTLLVGLVISVINLFIGNTIVDIILDWIILFVFLGFTAYDMNKITHMNELGVMEQEKLYVYGAMELYLDFVNIFLRILYIFGKRKN